MTIGLQTAAYISATVLFILALGGLSNQEKAKRAVWFGIVGMAIAVVATVAEPSVTLSSMLIGAIVIGAVIGVVVANRVEMTGMPQLVAALHSFVGLAAVFIGLNSDMSVHDFASNAERIIHEVEIFLGVFIGAVTFTGSIIAYGKLAGKIGGKALILPGRHLLNLAMVGGSFVLLLMYMNHAGSWTLYVMTVLALLLGVHLVMAIGGADMPVVVSMLNSYSGWAAAAMCKAMNRQFLSVILGGWGDATGPAMEIEGEQIAIDVDGVASALDDADSVIIVPGYGMAVAQAQQSVSEMTRRLRAKGKDVRFAIHPVAGRLPGHMNVLLAEAKVPYDIVLEMDEINEDFGSTDVVIVIGSNDIVNPAAQEDPNSPIAGMPVLEVWNAKQVIVSKRGQGTGYSGIENPLFYKENTRMFYGDAKSSLDQLLTQIS